MTVTSKVRIYDLAKELKLDTKRLIEEVRREGVDVSVPSNSVSKELAEKIRNKYFPKKETAVKRAVKVVKRAARPVEEAAPVEAEPAAEPEEIVAAPSVAPEPPPPTPAAAPPKPARLIKKLTPAARAEQPVDITPEAPPLEEPPELEAELPEAVAPVESAPPADVSELKSAPAPSRQIRVLRPTAAALNAGIRPGERAPAPTPPPVAPPRDRPERPARVRERPSLPRAERLGTPGETATPQTTYIPPPDSGRRRSRRSSPRGGRKIEGKAGRFDKGDFIPPPKALSLEDRIAGRLEAPSSPGELKAVRLIEGSTVKEFAEKLGIKPKDVVTLLLQRGVFATINQPLMDDVASDLGKRFGYDVSFVPFEEMVAEEEF
ncbi:MAG TPA: translation initiation factor IF-2 N-terminal domain-containing protein, partial [Pyrinomonadaceae bacterium]|nr:translation initiation factor IF-2 N-terminal domain-containing protein [Pyrinomonadaceae bacterium]